jgi:hypothetical protein
MRERSTDAWQPNQRAAWELNQKAHFASVIKLNLRLLFDPRFDILPPRIVVDKPGFVLVSSLNGKQTVRIPMVMNGKLAYLIGLIIGDGYVSKRQGGSRMAVVSTGEL